MNKYISWIASLILLTHASMALSGDLIPESQQKARILQYLIETVKWPATVIQKNEFNLCLLGDFEDLSPFEQLDEKVINKHTVQVRKLPNYNNKNLTCEILYISKSEKAREDQIKQLFKGKPTLLISDIEHFAMHGGGINFIMIGPKAGITVNLETLKESQIEFSLKEYNRITAIPSKEDLER